MNLKTSALIVIDAQNGFINERSARAIPAIQELADKWSAAGGSIVFTRLINHPGSAHEHLIDWTKMQAGVETEIAPALLPYATTVLKKVSYTFFTPEAEALVKTSGWTDLYFCGIATESCVMKSAIDAFERGLTPRVVKDASASHAGEVAHEAGLLVTGRCIGGRQLVTAASVQANLERQELIWGPLDGPNHSIQFAS